MPERGAAPPDDAVTIHPPTEPQVASESSQGLWTVYTGQRKGSLFALRWKHVDFEHGTVASFKTKTGAAQYFVADRGLMQLLEAWREHLGQPGDDEPLVRESDIGFEPKRLATVLRDEDLKAAKVTRAILFEADASNVEALRFHDLRVNVLHVGSTTRQEQTRGSRSVPGTSPRAT